MSPEKLPTNLLLPLATITGCITFSCLAENSSIEVLLYKVNNQILTKLGLILHFLRWNIILFLLLYSAPNAAASRGS